MNKKKLLESELPGYGELPPIKDINPNSLTLRKLQASFERLEELADRRYMQTGSDISEEAYAAWKVELEDWFEYYSGMLS